MLGQTGIPADSLWLEITETALLADVKASTVALRNLRSLGLHLAVDDFGTGYSSLTYLKRFPVEAIKIDRGFVAGLGLDTEDTTIVEAVVNLGHSFGIAVDRRGPGDAAAAVAPARRWAATAARATSSAAPARPPSSRPSAVARLSASLARSLRLPLSRDGPPRTRLQTGRLMRRLHVRSMGLTHAECAASGFAWGGP